jgi:hypothetical protein
VSNSDVSLLRFLKRAALVVALGAVILVAGASVYLRIEQHRFRKQAERLLSEVRELELKKPSAAEVRLVVTKWGFEEWQTPVEPCTEDDCIYRLQLTPPARAHNFAAPFIWEPTARVLEVFGLRLSVVHAWLRIRGKALRSVSFSVWTLGRGCGGIRCTLVADADTWGGGSWSSRDRPEVKLRHSLLHADYLVGTFPAVLNADTGGSPSVVVWAGLSPDANAADVSRLIQFDLGCLTRLLSCRNRDLMPTVWAQSIADERESPKALTCTPELSKRVAQLADVIATVRLETNELSPSRYEGLPPALRNLEIVGLIKKTKLSRLSKGQHMDVEVDTPEMMTSADTRSRIRAGQQYVFLLQEHNYDVLGSNALYPCGVLTLNASNVAMMREAASSGAD